MIIIIGILAAIAIPMFLDQRDKAKDSAVKGGTHNIELGIASYAVDHNDQYPDVVDKSTATRSSWTPAGPVRRQLAGEPLVERRRHGRAAGPGRLHVRTQTGRQDGFHAGRPQLSGDFVVP